MICVKNKKNTTYSSHCEENKMCESGKQKMFYLAVCLFFIYLYLLSSFLNLHLLPHSLTASLLLLHITCVNVFIVLSFAWVCVNMWNQPTPTNLKGRYLKKLLFTLCKVLVCLLKRRQTAVVVFCFDWGCSVWISWHPGFLPILPSRSSSPPEADAATHSLALHTSFSLRNMI